MGSGSGFPIDLVLFGMIAAFLVLRLRSILGRRTGYERPPQAYPTPADKPAGPVIEGRSEPAPPPTRPIPEAASATGQVIQRLQAVDSGFDPVRFLDGAEQAFRIIVGAFAAGNLDTLRNLLTPDTFHAFEAAIAEREAAGQTQQTEIRAIKSATIEEATLLDTIATLTVRYVSDQVSLVTGRDGQVISGTDALTEIVDIWTFERDLASRDPTWRLVSARSA